MQKENQRHTKSSTTPFPTFSSIRTNTLDRLSISSFLTGPEVSFTKSFLSRIKTEVVRSEMVFPTISPQELISCFSLNLSSSRYALSNSLKAASRGAASFFLLELNSYVMYFQSSFRGLFWPFNQLSSQGEPSDLMMSDK